MNPIPTNDTFPTVCLVTRGLIYVAVFTATVAAQTVVIHEPGWREVARVPVTGPRGAHFSAFDGAIYVGSRPSDSNPIGWIVRIAPDLATTTVLTSCDRPAAVVVDRVRGDVFFTEDVGGVLFRLPAGAAGPRDVWVSAFGGGSHDPCGMAIAPPDYAGPAIVQPGDALLVDYAPDQIWKWRPGQPEGAQLVFSDNLGLAGPRDIAIGRRGIWFVDNGATTALYELAAPGLGRRIPTPLAWPGVNGIAVDPANDTLLLRSDLSVFRFDPATGLGTEVLQVATGTLNAGSVAGVDVSPDGRFMALSLRAANLVVVFERTASYALDGTGCGGSSGVPGLSSSALPRLGTVFPVLVGNLPASAPALGLLSLTTNNSALDGIGMTGCRLLVNTDVATVLTVRPTANSALWTTSLPFMPVLEGVRFHQQAFAADPTANPAGVIASNRGNGVLSSFQ
ncbi:MAG: hypothetical protein IPK26_12490 [Planctomycetes bacterium]|nr:hypothetical protein [Planctomycetota bacterium]